MIEERLTWPVRAVLSGGGGFRPTSYRDQAQSQVLTATVLLQWSRCPEAADSSSVSALANRHAIASMEPLPGGSG